MDLTPYVDHLRRELETAAAAGDPRAQDLAGRLTAPLESAARLALLNALSDAADEITRELATGSVEIRLRGLDPGFVVTPPPAPGTGADDGDDGDGDIYATDGPPKAAAAPAEPSVPQPEGDDGGTARITLRVPDHLKPRIEEAATREGLSVNAWLVRAVTAALDPGPRSRDRRGAPGSRPGPGSDPGTGRTQGPRYRQRYTGWVR